MTTPLFRSITGFTALYLDYFDYFVIKILIINSIINLLNLSSISLITVNVIFSCCLNACMPHHFCYNSVAHAIIIQRNTVCPADFVCGTIINVQCLTYLMQLSVVPLGMGYLCRLPHYQVLMLAHLLMAVIAVQSCL